MSARTVVRRASVKIAEPPHLCRVQAATRELCRSAGLDEGDVFSAVIAVTELAHRFFIEGARSGGVELEIVRRKRGLSLDVREANADRESRVLASMKFPPPAGPSFTRPPALTTTEIIHE